MKNIFLIIITILAIGAAIYFWSSYMGADTTTATVARVSADGQRSKEVAELLGILKTLRSIKIDSAYVNDPVFQSLIDFSPPMAETINKGRPNPFIPASGINAYVTTSTTTKSMGR